jgi:hypothetical protein
MQARRRDTERGRSALGPTIALPVSSDWRCPQLALEQLADPGVLVPPEARARYEAARQRALAGSSVMAREVDPIGQHGSLTALGAQYKAPGSELTAHAQDVHAQQRRIV